MCDRTPWIAVLFTWSLGGFAFLSAQYTSLKVLIWLVNLAAIAGLVCWVVSRDQLWARGSFFQTDCYRYCVWPTFECTLELRLRDTRATVSLHGLLLLKTDLHHPRTSVQIMATALLGLVWIRLMHNYSLLQRWVCWI
jgi:hypothetical protein